MDTHPSLFKKKTRWKKKQIFALQKKTEMEEGQSKKRQSSIQEFLEGERAKKLCIELEVAVEPYFLTDLRANGYAVVKGCVPLEKTSEIRSDFWGWLESFKSGVDRNDPSTWRRETLPFALHGGLMQHCGSGQHKAAWDARQLDEVVSKFVAVYGGEEKLLVSMDGVNFSRPNFKGKNRPWPHVDQGHTKSGFQCAQGFLNLNECGPNDGGLVIRKGSHLLHDKIWESGKKTAKNDWYKFTEEEVEDLFSQCEEVKVCCSPGDLVLWDSRTVHWAKSPENGGRYRMVIYVSYQPAALARPRDIANKQKAYNMLRQTSHWGAQGVHLFAEKPNPKFSKGTIVDRPKGMVPQVLSERGKRLAGLVPY